MIVKVAPQARNGNPPDDNDSDGKADLFEGIYHRRVEVEGVMVVDCTGVCSGEGEGFHFSQCVVLLQLFISPKQGSLDLGCRRHQTPMMKSRLWS